MDVRHELNGIRFVWNDEKARLNLVNHDGISFQQAAEVFFDPFVVIENASRNDESRDAPSASISPDVCCTSCTSSSRANTSGSFRPARPPHRSANAMISERIRTRLRKDRPMTTITLRIPIDVVEALKELAPKTGHSGYQALLKAYIGEGLRRDEAKYFFGPAERLADALRRRGVPDDLLKDAMQDLAA